MASTYRERTGRDVGRDLGRVFRHAVSAQFITPLIGSFIDALFMQIAFNFSGVSALADLGYWQLYWINYALLMPIGTAIGIVVIGQWKLFDIFYATYSKTWTK